MTTLHSWTALNKMLVYCLQNLLVLDQFSIHGWLTNSAIVGNVVLLYMLTSDICFYSSS